MRIWCVLAVLAVVVMLVAGQTVWAQATPTPAGDTAAGSETPSDPTGADKKPDKEDGSEATPPTPTAGDNVREDGDGTTKGTDKEPDKNGKTKTDSDDDKDKAPSGFGDMRFIVVMIAVMALLWWWMGRGRRKEQQKHREMLSTLKKGDKVTSIGGIIGTVIEVKDKEVVVKVDESSNTRMKFLRSAIRNIGRPSKDNDEGSRKS